MSFYCYAIMPIDYGWDNLETIGSVAAKFAKQDALLAVAEDKYEPRKLSSFWEALKRSYELARSAGWEGDFRSTDGPRVFFVPGIDNDMEFGFVWKQDNNGTTFVVSPYEFPWLDRLR